jgi:thymidylate synthase
MMNTIEKEYQNLLAHVLLHGEKRKDRTGTGTLSVFGWQLRHSMWDGFPLLTTKKMAWKSIVTELLWFLRGDTNIRYLVINDCNIWNGDAYKNFCRLYDEGFPGALKLTQEEYIEKLKSDLKFAGLFGDLGPIYGKQWRDWNGVDQIKQVLYEAKRNPNSRRLMVNAWNVDELDAMVLPPCHYGFQLYVRTLSIDERWQLLCDKVGGDMFGAMVEGVATFGGGLSEELEKFKIPRKGLSLMWNQRSVDSFLGLPFNIASYGLLLEIFSAYLDMAPDQLIGNLGDVHLYSNHVDQANELLRRQPYDLPKLKVNDRIRKLPVDDFDPLVHTMTSDDFVLENYTYHPTIKAPLSN